MNPAKPENELIQLRRTNSRLLKMLLDGVDKSRNYDELINDLHHRLTHLESMIAGAQKQAARRLKETGSTPTNDIATAKE